MEPLQDLRQEAPQSSGLEPGLQSVAGRGFTHPPPVPPIPSQHPPWAKPEGGHLVVSSVAMSRDPERPQLAVGSQLCGSSTPQKAAFLPSSLASLLTHLHYASSDPAAAQMGWGGDGGLFARPDSPPQGLSWGARLRDPSPGPAPAPLYSPVSLLPSPAPLLRSHKRALLACGAFGGHWGEGPSKTPLDFSPHLTPSLFPGGRKQTKNLLLPRLPAFLPASI